MARSAVAVDWIAVAIIAYKDTVPVNGGATRTTVVGDTAAGMAVRVTRLDGVGGEYGKTGGKGQQGEELFHD